MGAATAAGFCVRRTRLAFGGLDLRVSSSGSMVSKPSVSRMLGSSALGSSVLGSSASGTSFLALRTSCAVVEQGQYST